MSDEDKGFLARWSQRKREAAKAEPKEAASEGAAQPTIDPPQALGEPEPAFDLDSLPKLEDLTKDTDMTVFFKKGVPEGIRNAALRKSWALDPAIRNYVNPALDYAYDWNTLGGVPGSGELAPGTDIARMVAEVFGQPTQAVDNAKQVASSVQASLVHDENAEMRQPAAPAQAVRLTDAAAQNSREQRADLSEQSAKPADTAVAATDRTSEAVDAEPRSFASQHESPANAHKHGSARPR